MNGKILFNRWFAGEMPTKRNHILWVVALGLMFATGICFIVVWNEVSSADFYPLGMGNSKHSPNGIYEARASNMVDKIDGEIVRYYEFEIIRRSNGTVIVEKRIPEAEQEILFREGNGMILWEPDSNAVRFGTAETTLWAHDLVKN